MLKLSQFTSGGRKPNGLLNGASLLSPMSTNLSAPLAAGNTNARSVLTPALVSGVLTTILSLSGKGCISFLACAAANGTAKTHQLKVTLDGVVIFDGTSLTNTITSVFYPAIGGLAEVVYTQLALGVVHRDLDFDESLLVQYACSVSETAGTFVAYSYFPRA